MSDSPRGRTALVTGATGGIGRATAKALCDNGFRVIGTSRDPGGVPDAARLPGVEYVALDLAVDASVVACAERVSRAGGVDVLVNNAGESQFGPLEEVPAEDVERLFRTNVFGPVRLTQLLLPGMRERGFGRVVMVGSMNASFPLAFRSGYTGAKAAIKGFATAARHELSPHGVWVTTVEPGSIATGISERRTKYLRDGSPYTRDYETVLNHLDSNERSGVSPEKVAEVIVRAVLADRPRPLYAVGSNAPVVFAVRRLLPRGVTERLMSRKHGLRR